MSHVPTENPTQEFPNYRWVVMGIWLTASVAGFMIMSTIGILLPAISAELGCRRSNRACWVRRRIGETSCWPFP